MGEGKLRYGYAYYIDGELHRDDGPAVDDGYGNIKHWLEGVEHTYKDYQNRNIVFPTKHTDSRCIKTGNIIEPGDKYAECENGHTTFVSRYTLSIVDVCWYCKQKEIHTYLNV